MNHLIQHAQLLLIRIMLLNENQNEAKPHQIKNPKRWGEAYSSQAKSKMHHQIKMHRRREAARHQIKNAWGRD